MLLSEQEGKLFNKSNLNLCSRVVTVKLCELDLQWLKYQGSLKLFFFKVLSILPSIIPCQIKLLKHQFLKQLNYFYGPLIIYQYKLPFQTGTQIHQKCQAFIYRPDYNIQKKEKYLYYINIYATIKHYLAVANKCVLHNLEKCRSFKIYL